MRDRGGWSPLDGEKRGRIFENKRARDQILHRTTSSAPAPNHTTQAPMLKSSAMKLEDKATFRRAACGLWVSLNFDHSWNDIILVTALTSSPERLRVGSLSLPCLLLLWRPNESGCGLNRVLAERRALHLLLPADLWLDLDVVEVWHSPRDIHRPSRIAGQRSHRDTLLDNAWL